MFRRAPVCSFRFSRSRSQCILSLFCLLFFLSSFLFRCHLPRSNLLASPTKSIYRNFIRIQLIRAALARVYEISWTNQITVFFPFLEFSSASLIFFCIQFTFQNTERQIRLDDCVFFYQIWNFAKHCLLQFSLRITSFQEKERKRRRERQSESYREQRNNVTNCIHKPPRSSVMKIYDKM